MTIALAANYSPQLMELLAEDPLEFLTYIKVPLTSPPQGQIKDARRYRPGLLHCWGEESIILGAASPDKVINRENVAEMVELTDTPYVSTHLNLTFTDFAAIGGFDCEDAYHLVYDHLAENTFQVKSCLNRDLILENLDFTHGRPASAIPTNPRFISEFLAEIDCGLLLDIGHAQVSAWHLGYEFTDYLKSLPLDRVVELHVHAPRCLPGQGLIDEHLPLRPKDYDLIRWLIEHTPVQTISLEYGGAKEFQGDPERNSKAALYEQLVQLRTLLDRA